MRQSILLCVVPTAGVSEDMIASDVEAVIVSEVA